MQPGRSGSKVTERVSSRWVGGSPRAGFMGIGPVHSHRGLCLVECSAVAALKFLTILNTEPHIFILHGALQIT